MVEVGWRRCRGLTGMAETTVRRGLRDLEAGEEWEPRRVRRAGAARPAVTDSDTKVEQALDGLLELVTVGDPKRVSVRWTSKSAAKLAEELRGMAHQLVDRDNEPELGQLVGELSGSAQTRLSSPPKRSRRRGSISAATLLRCRDPDDHRRLRGLQQAPRPFLVRLRAWPTPKISLPLCGAPDNGIIPGGRL